MYTDEIHKAILEEEDPDSYIPKARRPEHRVESKARNPLEDVRERCMFFLQYKNPKVFAIRTSHLNADDLEFMLSSAKSWNRKGLTASQRLFWKLLKDSTPR